MSFRIGFGYDVHQLIEGIPLFIGGLNVPHTKGSLGHSDADVLIHAICDAMLGAINQRDIGFHFPDTNQEYKGIDSKILLEKTYNIIQSHNYSIVNIDSTVCLQKPKLANFIPQMQEIMGNILQTSPQNISIKATTTERMGFVGTEDGISAYAVVLLEQKTT
jgi:2-C-methyl-D-erythritol 2,4-cyclodiphosphate synthase